LRPLPLPTALPSRVIIVSCDGFDERADLGCLG